MNIPSTPTVDIHPDFRTAIRDTLPPVLGLAPFAMLVGITMVERGLSDVQAISMSAIMFSGAAQLAAVELLVIGSHPLVIVFAAMVVNSRFMMFSASIAPYFSKYSTKEKWFLAFFLGDLHYTIAIKRFRDDDISIYWYYVGTAVTVYLTWVLATVLGVIAGARLPEELDLGFAIVLVFVALLFSLIENSLDAIVALIAGLASILATRFPYDLGLVIAPLVGVSLGLMIRRIHNG